MPPKGCQAELIKFKTSQPSRQSLNTSDWPEILHGLLIYYSEPEKQRKKWFWTPFIFSIRPTVIVLVTLEEFPLDRDATMEQNLGSI